MPNAEAMKENLALDELCFMGGLLQQRSSMANVTAAIGSYKEPPGAIYSSPTTAVMTAMKQAEEAAKPPTDYLPRVNSATLSMLFSGENVGKFCV